MKILLAGVNASYSHTCLAIRSIGEYLKNQYFCKDSSLSVKIEEFTINQPVGEILRGIYRVQPDVVLFATYIWNAEIICKILPDVKKILPEVIIGAGGPEFGFAAENYLAGLPALDFVIGGEGEETVREVVHSFLETQKEANSKGYLSKQKIKNIKGLYFRDEQNKIIFTGQRELICNLSDIPFPYPELKEKQCNENKIYYYESSRGCPYSCAYCMSSLDKRVRFMPLDRVFDDLHLFLSAKVPLVKFVDRTYNLQPNRYIAIWQYILDHHNGITMFHFEIEAEYLTDEALEFLQKVPPKVMQFEIGVQSSNKKTLETVGRSSNIETLEKNIRQIPRTIHQHLDLIAGLPYENLETFGKSFDFVMSFFPDALQLGFLKILHGTQMEEYATKNGWLWMKNPVYETFSTPYMSYQDMLFLKDVEILVDAYWNSGVFSHVMNFIGRKIGFWNFFKKMAELGSQKEVFLAAHRETFWFDFLYENISSIFCDGEDDFSHGSYNCISDNDFNNITNSVEKLNSIVLYDLLRYDFMLRGKQGNWPVWYNHFYNKDRHRELLEQKGVFTNARYDFGHSEYEVFYCNPDSDFPEKTVLENFKQYEKLILYKVRK